MMIEGLEKMLAKGVDNALLRFGLGKGYLDAGDDQPGRALAQQAHGEVGSQEDERKAEGAPGGVPAKQGDRQLHQVVAGDDDEDVEGDQAGQGAAPGRRRRG